MIDPTTFTQICCHITSKNLTGQCCNVTAVIQIKSGKNHSVTVQ